ncbi:MAG: cytochrome c3 family protein [Gammaproteobacteria bacterium]
MKLPDRRYLAFALGWAVIASLPLFAGFTHWGWELSEILGFVGLLACLALSGCPVRPRETTPSTLLSMGRHEALGWIAASAAALHIVLALATDHTVIEYLKPSSPLYQLAGIAAFLLLVILVATSAASLRRRLWRSHRNFQAVHIIVGCVLLALLAAHVLTTGRYAGGYLRRVALVSVAMGGIAILLIRRRTMKGAAPDSTVARRFAFGRHSTLTVSVIAATMLVLTILIPGRAAVALREPVLPRSETLPLTFDHAKHVAVNCLACHHNYADGRGFDACIHCHRGAGPAIKVGVEARFHDFCLNCHRNPDPRLLRHGPVSGCADCHVAEPDTLKGIAGN